MMPFQLLRTMSLFRSPGTLNTPTTLLKKEGLMREWGGVGWVGGRQGVVDGPD